MLIASGCGDSESKGIADPGGLCGFGVQDCYCETDADCGGTFEKCVEADPGSTTRVCRYMPETGTGGTGGQGGARGELEDGQCWTDEDCNLINVWCVPLEYEGFPELAEGERGICEATTENHAFALFPRVGLVDATSEELTGAYLVHWKLTTSSDEPLSPLGSFPGVEFPAEGTFGTIHGGWPFQFGMRFYLEVRLPEETVSCDMLMDTDGMVSGGEIIEGDDLVGALRCPGDGAHLLVSYEISELE